MIFAAATFIVVVALVVGIYWVMLERPETREQGELRKRLRSAAGPRGSARIDFVKEVEKLSTMKAFDAVLSRTSGLTSSLQRLIAQADVKITVGGLLLVSVCIFLFASVIVGRLTRLPWLGLAVGALLALHSVYPREAQGGQTPAHVRGAVPRSDRSDRARAARGARLHDRAGHRGRRGAAAGGRRVPPALRPAELRHAARRCAEGVRRAHPAARRAVLRHGGDDAARERRQPRGDARQPGQRHPRTFQGEAPGAGDLGARPDHGVGAVGAAAVLSRLGMMIAAPGHMMTLVTDPVGNYMIFAALFLQITGTLIIRKLVNIEY